MPSERRCGSRYRASCRILCVRRRRHVGRSRLCRWLPLPACRCCGQRSACREPCTQGCSSPPRHGASAPSAVRHCCPSRREAYREPSQTACQAVALVGARGCRRKPNVQPSLQPLQISWIPKATQLKN